MCKISKKTLLRANRRMIEHGGRQRTNNAILSDGSFQVSVLVNGRTYSKIVTQQQIHAAFASAMGK